MLVLDFHPQVAAESYDDDMLVMVVPALLVVSQRCTAIHREMLNNGGGTLVDRWAGWIRSSVKNAEWFWKFANHVMSQQMYRGLATDETDQLKNSLYVFGTYVMPALALDSRMEPIPYYSLGATVLVPNAVSRYRNDFIRGRKVVKRETTTKSIERARNASVTQYVLTLNSGDVLRYTLTKPPVWL